MKHNFLFNFYYQNLSPLATAAKTIRRNLKGTKFETDVEALKRIVKHGWTCFDIGGSFGRYALPMSLAVGSNGKVFCFEPGSYSFKVLSIIKLFHHLKNVAIYKLAVSDKKGTISLYLPIKQNGKIGTALAFISDTNHNNAISEEVDMTSIDDFCMENKIEQVDFIKCDTEGSETRVIKGAENVIRKSRPFILCEVDIGETSGYSDKAIEIENLLKNVSYKIFTYRDGKFILHDKISETSNYFFVPAEKTIEA
ncbi:MAG: FkbM family methyltransferase [Candidatus Omnitrophota bacterium]